MGWLEDAVAEAVRKDTGISLHRVKGYTGPDVPLHGVFPPEADEFIRQHYRNTRPAWLSRQLKLPFYTIRRRAAVLGLEMTNKVFSQADTTIPDKQIYDGVNRNPSFWDTPSPLSISIYQLTRTTCRWPIGLPGEPGFGYCGETVFKHLPYCQEHCSIAYQNIVQPVVAMRA